MEVWLMDCNGRLRYFPRSFTRSGRMCPKAEKLFIIFTSVVQFGTSTVKREKIISKNTKNAFKEISVYFWYQTHVFLYLKFSEAIVKRFFLPFTEYIDLQSWCDIGVICLKVKTVLTNILCHNIALTFLNDSLKQEKEIEVRSPGKQNNKKYCPPGTLPLTPCPAPQKIHSKPLQLRQLRVEASHH